MKIRINDKKEFVKSKNEKVFLVTFCTNSYIPPYIVYVFILISAQLAGAVK